MHIKYIFMLHTYKITKNIQKDCVQDYFHWYHIDTRYN